MEPFSCWVVTDGRAGIESQALGLAEAVARLAPLRITNKRIEVKEPWRRLHHALWGDPFAHLSTEGALLRPPYPDLWIACGRIAAPYTMAVNEIERGTLTVQLQDPRAKAARFDLVIPPYHDGLSGANVFPIIGSPNRVTPELIRQDAERLAPVVEALPRPFATILIGGGNRAYAMSKKSIMRIARAARRLARAGFGVLVTPSRRTPTEAITTLRRALANFPHFIWEGAPANGLANPYFGLLGLADLILVTNDSVNMAAEAAMTGKPVYVLPLSRREFGASPAKFERFHEALAAHGATRPYTGFLEGWSYEPLDETARAAREVARRLAEKSQSRLRREDAEPSLSE